jgi:argininosuccinate synthase
VERIVLAYSGSLGTSVAIPWLAERYGAEVIAVTLDLGQGEELESVRDRALATGALRAHVLDARDEFARDYVLPALQADAVDAGGHPIAAALSRPLIASKLTEIAGIEQATGVAHGGAAAGEPLDVAARALNPTLPVFAPARDWKMTRSDVMGYAQSRHLALPSDLDRPYSVDRNLWGRSVRWDGAAGLRSEDVCVLTRALASCPNEPASIELAFDRGAPVAINGVAMSFLDLVGSLGIIVAAHGVGRIPLPEGPSADRAPFVLCEAPAAVVLHAARRALAASVSPKDIERQCGDTGLAYAHLIASGEWFDPARVTLDAAVAAAGQRVTGVVKLRLFKGTYRVEAATQGGT